MIAINAALGGFYIGYNFAVVAISIKEMKKIFDPDDDDLFETILNTILLVGALFGACFGGIILANKGRKLSMIVIDILSLMGLVVEVFAVEYSDYIILIHIGRSIAGVAVGLNSFLIPLYIKEMSPLCMSGKTGVYYQIFIVCGQLGSALMGLFLDETNTIENMKFKMYF